MLEHGFVRVAAALPRLRVANCEYNVERILELMRQAGEQDVHILVFAFGLSILTGMFFGLAPAIQASRPQLTGVLKEGGRNASAGSGHRLRTAFVVTEIALAVVLLVGSGLLLKSLFRLLNTSPGFNP